MTENDAYNIGSPGPEIHFVKESSKNTGIYDEINNWINIKFTKKTFMFCDRRRQFKLQWLCTPAKPFTICTVYKVSYSCFCTHVPVYQLHTYYTRIHIQQTCVFTMDICLQCTQQIFGIHCKMKMCWSHQWYAYWDISVWKCPNTHTFGMNCTLLFYSVCVPAAHIQCVYTFSKHGVGRRRSRP